MTPDRLSRPLVRRAPLLRRDQTVGAAVQRVLDSGLPALPVVDAQNRLVGIFGELVVRGGLIVEGDAAATANNILGSETLFRAGLAGDILGYVASIAVAMILYVLLEPVSRNLGRA